jgi:DUF4097 and DUF4098 domain-containing protein YvlB
MASPYANPVPPPPTAYRYRRSVAGPLILIFLGAVFLLITMGNAHSVWRFYGKFWPVLIILWGIVALIEHFTAIKNGYQTRGLGGGGVLLLILIVASGLAAHHGSDVNWEGMREQMQIDDDLGGMFGNSYTFEETLEQQFPAKGSLRIVCDRGAINVTPSDDRNLRVVVHKKLYAKSQDDANSYNEGTKPQISVSGASVVLNANTNGSGDHGVSADMDVYVPRDAAVEIASKRGDVSVNDRESAVQINLQRGDAALDGITGPVQVNVDKGSVRAQKIKGSISIAGHVDDATIEDVDGSVQLNGDFFNDIRLNKVTGRVDFKSARSDISIASVPGDIEISGDSLRATDVSGPMRLITRSKQIHIEDVRGDLEVENSNGPIEIHPADKLPIGKIKISGNDGITLVLPPNAGFQLDATARMGAINSDFTALKIDSRDRGARATGTVGNGAAKVEINADRGDISISKG